MQTIILRKKIEICRKGFKRSQNAAYRMRSERSCWGKVTLRQSAPTWHRHRQISCTSTANWAHSAAETDVFQDGKTQVENDKAEVGHRLGGRESCWCCSGSCSSKVLGQFVQVGQPLADKSLSTNKARVQVFYFSIPSPWRPVSVKQVYAVKKEALNSKQPGLICQIVTECIWLCTWATKGVSR